MRDARTTAPRPSNAFGGDKRATDSIKIGKRHRRDMGDIDALAKSISEIGLLHPIVVTKDKTLVAGERRLAACKQLGWTDVRVTVVDLDKITRGEFAENAIRKDFVPSEIDAIRRALEPVEKAATTLRRAILATRARRLGLSRRRNSAGGRRGIREATLAR
jgi:ParB/RepB/Spo0J family partition protein